MVGQEVWAKKEAPKKMRFREDQAIEVTIPAPSFLLNFLEESDGDLVCWSPRNPTLSEPALCLRE